MIEYKLFLDLDGVLADFNRGVYELTGKQPEELKLKSMWGQIARSDRFFDRLSWTEDGRSLWSATQHLSPIILTGLPHGKWAAPQKRSWCARELGSEVSVITCMSRDKGITAKEYYTSPTIPLLIDDRVQNQAGWEKEGGHFILHRSAQESLAAMRSLGLE